MNTLIIYASKTGAAKKCGEKIKKGLVGTSEMMNYKAFSGGSLDKYDNVVLGTPVYAGTLNKEFKDFVAANEESLKKKNVFLYLSCMDGTQKEAYINNNLTEEQRQLFKKIVCCGGAFYFSKMNFFEKLIIKKIANSKKENKASAQKVDGKTDIEMFDDQAIEALTKEINQQ